MAFDIQDKLLSELVKKFNARNWKNIGEHHISYKYRLFKSLIPYISRYKFELFECHAYLKTCSLPHENLMICRPLLVMKLRVFLREQMFSACIAGKRF